MPIRLPEELFVYVRNHAEGRGGILQAEFAFQSVLRCRQYSWCLDSNRIAAVLYDSIDGIYLAGEVLSNSFCAASFCEGDFLPEAVGIVNDVAESVAPIVAHGELDAPP